MNVSLVNSLSAGAQGDDPVSLLMLRKALDLQAQGAAQLLQSAQVASVSGSNPPHLGQNIDIKV
ncbi:MAG TPA: YjfB family protein [Terriglobales bacterium]|nr:YjfB family protein [Terriglobales bacterium]